MYCIYCGKELPEEARFCSRCGKPQPIDPVPPEPTPEPAAAVVMPDAAAGPGSPYIPPPDPPKPQPTPVPELGQEFYDALAAAFDQPDPVKPDTPPEPTISVPPATEALSTVTPPQPPAKWTPPVFLRKPLPRKTIFLILGGLLLLILLAAGIARLLSPKPIGPDALVYLTSDQRNLMFRKDLKSDTQPEELSDIAASNVIFSEDGKHLYFSNSGNLYCSNLSKAGEQDAAKKVSAGVEDFTVMKNGGAVYITGAGGDSRMYYYDGVDSILLTSGVNSVYNVDFAGKSETILQYEAIAEDGGHTCSRVPLDGSAPPETVLEGFDKTLYWGSDFVVYSVWTGSDAPSSWLYPVDVYSQAIGGGRTLLAEDVFPYLFVDGEGDKFSMTYASNYDPQTSRFDLCGYENGKVTTLVSDVDELFAHSGDIFLYGRYDGDGVLRYHQTVKGTESELLLDEGVSIHSAYILSDSDVILALDTPDGQILQACKISKNQLTIAETLCDDESFNDAYIMYGTCQGKTVLYYCTDVDSEAREATIMRCVDGKSAVVGSKAANALILSDGSAVLTVDEDGVLFLIDADGNRERVTNETSEFAVLSGQKIVYISHGDLYVWNNGRTEKLADDAAQIFVPREAEYDCYLP